METIEIEQIADYCKSKDFDVLRINYKVGDPKDVQETVQAVLEKHELISKDGYKTYDAIGMQYTDSENPLYDAVQQTFEFKPTRFQQHRPKSLRFKTRNEIGQSFNIVYDVFNHYGIQLERGRILRANPGHNHNVHIDNDIRIHLPVITNPECQMVYTSEPSDHEYHLAADGHTYLINGHRMHYFYNHGTEDRIHIVWILQQELFINVGN